MEQEDNVDPNLEERKVKSPVYIEQLLNAIRHKEQTNQYLYNIRKNIKTDNRAGT